MSGHQSAADLAAALERMAVPSTSPLYEDECAILTEAARRLREVERLTDRLMERLERDDGMDTSDVLTAVDKIARAVGGGG